MRGKAKGNWFVHQRGASSVAYPSKRQAQNAARSLRNARVSRYYRPGAGGRHSASDIKPNGGCAVVALVLLSAAAAALAGAGYGLASLIS